MPTGEEVRAVPPQNVSPSSLGLEVEEIYLPSGRGRSVSLDIPLYRTGHLINHSYGHLGRSPLKLVSAVALALLSVSATAQNLDGAFHQTGGTCTTRWASPIHPYGVCAWANTKPSPERWD